MKPSGVGVSRTILLNSDGAADADTRHGMLDRAHVATRHRLLNSQTMIDSKIRFIATVKPP